MTKALDKRNEKARAKAGNSPYYKYYIESAKACPHCDGLLTAVPPEYKYECSCGSWTYEWIDGAWSYVHTQRKGLK